MLAKDHNGISLQLLTDLSLSAGELLDYEYVRASGLIVDADSSGMPAEVWGLGTLYTFSTSAVTHYISSSDDTDDQQIQIEGLDSDWLKQTSVVTLAGQTKTAIDGTWIRINKIRNVDSSEVAGTIYVYEDDTITLGVPNTNSKVRNIITPDFQRSSYSIYSVPADKNGFVLTSYSNIGPSKSTPIEDKSSVLTISKRPFGGIFRMMAMRIATKYESTVFHTFKLPFMVTPKSDIKITCTESFVDNTSIYAGFNLILKDL